MHRGLQRLGPRQRHSECVDLAVDRVLHEVGLVRVSLWQTRHRHYPVDTEQPGDADGLAQVVRLAGEGAKKVVCVIQDQGNVSLESRCAGVAAGFGGAVENLNVNGTDMPSAQATITAKLQQDPSIDHIVTLGAPIALTATDAVATAGSNAKIVTFDTNAVLVDAIKDGKVGWAIDQQPFLQGYLAVDSLWLFLNNGNVIGGGQPTLTGPAFIDKSNIDAIADYAKNGTR